MRSESRSDTGFTLIEMLLAMMIGLMIVGVGGGLLVAGLRSQQSISSDQTVSNSASNIDQSLTNAIHNAYQLSVTDLGGGDQIMRSMSLRATDNGAVTAQSWRCYAWYYQASSRKLFLKTSPTSTVATPTAATLPSWQVLSANVAPIAAAGSVFAGSGTGVNIGFVVTDGASRADSFSTTILPDPVPSPVSGAGGPTTCL